MKRIHSDPARILMATFAMLASIAALGGADLAAQQFGRNKVQYRTFDWQYIQSTHFDIYFYDSSGVNLAKFTANVAEAALTDLQDHLRYRINNRIPIVVYASHNDFQQTNVVGEYMPEGVGGVTELFKNRVVVPFEGDWEKFRHVIHHELVHAVLNDKFYGGSIQSLISNNVRFMLPLWMNEGLAEFESQGGYDIETDMFIRDAVIGEYLPDLEQLGGYFAYRGGQTFYWYVEQNYGRDKITELLNRAKATGSLEAAFRGAFGKSVSEFSDQWKYDLKKIYWPDVADKKRPRDFATLLTDHKKENSYFNTSPAISPNGDMLAFISDRDGPRSVYVMDIVSKEVHQLVEGENDVDFEELHLLTPAISWSPDSRRIAIAVKSKGRDAIFLIDVETSEQTKLEFDLDAIYSVDWSPDGKRLAFQGIKGDQSDIYSYELSGGVVKNITDDIFTDYDPNWAADNKTIYFLSDRRDHPIRTSTGENMLIWNYDYRTADIFSVNSESLALRRLTTSETEFERSPTPGPNGKLLFVSDRNGINNIYVMDSTGAASARPLTNSISGLEQLGLTRDGGRLVFTAWNGSGYDIFQMRVPFETRPEGDSLAPTEYLKRVNAVASSAAPTDSSASSAPVTAVTPIKGYGSVRVDPTEAVSTSASASTSPSGSSTPTGLASKVAPPEDSRTISGDYKVKDYRVRFTPDLIQASGNYSSFYGVQGVMQLLFSDMLGDHQFYVASNLQLDLKNSDFILSYSYLPERIDYALDVFQAAQFLWVRNEIGSSTFTRFRQYGASGRASNPFDRFNRLDFGLAWYNVSREGVGDTLLPDQSKSLIVPSMSYVFDNSSMWAFGPIDGSRYNVTAMASPKLGDDGVGFYTFLGDFRHYISLGSEYSIALRAAGGASFGPNPQKFFLGGVENWLNWEYGTNPLPIENAEDFSFLTPGYPMRGFNYSDQVGSKYMLGNAELRFPLFRALVTGPLPVLFQYVAGVIFVDAGTAWGTPTREGLELFETRADGTTVTKDLLLGTGIGARAYIFGFPVRFDVAWNYNLDSWSKPKYYLSLGMDF